MTARVINDPSALGWEYDPDTGRWTWGGGGSSGGGGGSFPEAPVDGRQYGRQDAGWTPIVGGGGVITTADVVLSNPQRSGLDTQEDANNYFYDSIQSGSGGNDPRVSDTQIANWDISFSWGDHSTVGYLTAETDPTVPAHVKAITQTDIANWNAGTGGGGGAGPDPRITDTQISNWDAAYGWGNHSTRGYLTSASLSGYATQSWVGQNYQPKGNYLTSFTESDPTVPSHVKSITTSDINKWNNPPSGGGGTDTFDDVVKRGSSTNTSPSAPNWQCLSNTYTLGGVAGAGARIISFDGQFNFYNASNAQTCSISTSGAITANGDVTAFSDARLKENVETLDGSKVYDMRGVSFTRDGREGSGVIAQELQKVAPELVHDDGEYLSVAYGNVVGYLIEAVKQLKAEVEDLRRNAG